ncbi:uncharacterized protein AAES06_006092 [Glossophaga mutica]
MNETNRWRGSKRVWSCLLGRTEQVPEQKDAHGKSSTPFWETGLLKTLRWHPSHIPANVDNPAACLLFMTLEEIFPMTNTHACPVFDCSLRVTRIPKVSAPRTRTGAACRDPRKAARSPSTRALAALWVMGKERNRSGALEGLLGAGAAWSRGSRRSSGCQR